MEAAIQHVQGHWRGREGANRRRQALGRAAPDPSMHQHNVTKNLKAYRLHPATCACTSGLSAPLRSIIQQLSSIIQGGTDCAAVEQKGRADTVMLLH